MISHWTIHQAKKVLKKIVCELFLQFIQQEPRLVGFYSRPAFGIYFVRHHIFLVVYTSKPCHLEMQEHIICLNFVHLQCWIYQQQLARHELSLGLKHWEIVVIFFTFEYILNRLRKNKINVLKLNDKNKHIVADALLKLFGYNKAIAIKTNTVMPMLYNQENNYMISFLLNNLVIHITYTPFSWKLATEN